jgi:hypothetical protein
MKLIHQFKALLPCLPNAKSIVLPCQIDYLGVDFNERSFFIDIDIDEKLSMHFTEEPHLYKFFQLTNVSVFTEKELREMSQLFGFDLLAYPNSPGIYSAVLNSTQAPESILYIYFHQHLGRDFCFIMQVNGRSDADTSLPFIWSVAEVELTKEFNAKLEHHWQEKRKVYS